MVTENKKKGKYKNPIELFFALGDKATKGDPIKKANFDYYMLWIMFFAFCTIFISNILTFIYSIDASTFSAFFANTKFSNLGWSLVTFAIIWFQYNTLKTARSARKLTKLIPQKDEIENVESAKDMLNTFTKENSETNERREK